MRTITVLPTGRLYPHSFGAKAQDEAIECAVEWKGRLHGDTLGAVTWEASTSDLTLGAPTNTTTRSTVLVSGGSAGTEYCITIKAPTSGGETLIARVSLRVLGENEC